MRKIATLSVFVLALVLVFSSASALTQEPTVTICHATASEANPYITNHPAADGDVSGHDSHDGGVFPDDPWGDIIPPFDYGDGQHYDGKNWTAEGQAIWENDCQVPEQEEYCPYDGAPEDLPLDSDDCQECQFVDGLWAGSEKCVEPLRPKISTGSCIVQDDNLFRIKIVVKGADGQYRLRGNSSGEIIGPFDLENGDVLNADYLGDPSTYTEDTWIKEYFNGEEWVGAGGTMVTSVEGHTRNEFFCPEEVVPTPTPPPHTTGGMNDNPAPFVAGVAALGAVILAVAVELKRRTRIA